MGRSEKRLRLANTSVDVVATSPTVKKLTRLETLVAFGEISVSSRFMGISIMLLQIEPRSSELHSENSVPVIDVVVFKDFSCLF